MSTLEVFAVAFGIISVFLSVRENVWSWPTAIVNVSLYVFVFHGAKLYADMGLQFVYIAISIYGWHQWLYGGVGHTELHVTRLPRKLIVPLVALGAGFSLTIGTALRAYTDASLPYIDSTTTATSLVAQWMMTRKYVENWAVWVAVDVVYIGMFTYKELYLTAGLYFVFLVLSALGFIRWSRAIRERGA